MRKFLSNILLPIAAISMLFKWRYRILNFILNNDSIRRMSVAAAMNIPGVRSRIISRVFRN